MDNTIRLWNVSTGVSLRTFEGNLETVESVAFSPDGKTLASGRWDNTIKLWNVSTGEQLSTLKGHSNEVYSIAFSPDGKVLASGSLDGTIKLWDVSTGAQLRTFGRITNAKPLGEAEKKVIQPASRIDLARAKPDLRDARVAAQSCLGDYTLGEASTRRR